MKLRFLLKSVLATLGLFLTIGGTAHARGESGENRPVARFTVWGEWLGKNLYIKLPEGSRKSDEGFLKLDLLDLGYSAEVPFRRALPIELCARIEKDGETIWQPLLKVSIPGEIREPLVMIFPNGDDEATSRVFDLHRSVFPFGSYQLVNLTELRMMAKFDETGIMLPPGGRGHFKGTGQSSFNVWLRVAAEGLDKNSYVVYSSMMKNRSDKRMFMFFHTSDASPDMPIAVRTLVDFEPQKRQ